jgi:hypothetical protein
MEEKQRQKKSEHFGMPSDLNDPTHEPLFLGHAIWAIFFFFQIKRTTVIGYIEVLWINQLKLILAGNLFQILTGFRG